MPSVLALRIEMYYSPGGAGCASTASYAGYTIRPITIHDPASSSPGEGPAEAMDRMNRA